MLPDEVSRPELELPEEPSRPSLELDTSELHTVPPREDDPEPSTPAPTPREARPSLELDLEGLDTTPPPPDGPPAEHDAWTVDRMSRRATPAAFPVVEETTPGVRVARVLSLPSEPTALPTPSEGDALDLVERSRPSVPEVDFATDMSERFALGDFTGALLAAELLLGRDGKHAEARRVALASRERLVQLYTSRLGPLDRPPRVVLPEHEIRWLGLDHRSGFLLSRIDGRATCEEVIDMSGMPRLEALRTLAELIAVGVVQL